MASAPSVGRIVHYVNRGTADGMFQPTCRAAVVTSLEDDGMVNLAIFNPHGLSFERGVEHNEEHLPNSWHWPERVADDPSEAR